MGMVLGVDGKALAVTVNSGVQVGTVGPYYIGLLETLPPDPDTVYLPQLVADEFIPDPDWYLGGRKAITFSGVMVTAAGGRAHNTTAISWANDSGVSKFVEGVFITTAQSGINGMVLWIGPPDLGTMEMVTGTPVDIDLGALVLQID